MDNEQDPLQAEEIDSFVQHAILNLWPQLATESVTDFPIQQNFQKEREEEEQVTRHEQDRQLKFLRMLHDIPSDPQEFQNGRKSMKSLKLLLTWHSSTAHSPKQRLV